MARSESRFCLERVDTLTARYVINRPNNEQADKS